MPFLIVLTGIFFFNMSDKNITDIPQAAYFLFSAGIILSILIARKNIVLGIMLGWVSMIFLYTILLRDTSKVQALDFMMTSFALAGIYYAVRIIRWKEDCLKWFLVPAIVNIIFVMIQRFYPHILPIQSREVCGLLGNAGLTATFLGMTTAIFCKYFKPGLPLLFLAIILLNGYVGMVAFVASWIFYNYGHNKKVWIPCSFFSLGIGIIYIFHNPQVFMLRLSMWSGALEGIMRHPILGWGMGSFVEIMSRVPVLDSMHFGVKFNTAQAIMNHPANEFLFGAWNFGIPFMIMMIYLVWYVIKSFSPSKLFTSTILLSGFITAMGFMFKPPTLFLLVLAFAMFENKPEESI